MQITQPRSSSKKSIRCLRDSPQSKQKTYLQVLQSKVGDVSERNFSKHLIRDTDNNNKARNAADNTEYIRNLYKKYLGKQNISDRKTKTDVKYIKNEGKQQRNIENIKMRLDYQNKNNIDIWNPIQTHSDLNKKQTFVQMVGNGNNQRLGSQELICQKQEWKKSKKQKKNFYEQMIDNKSMIYFSDKRNSLVLALKTLNKIRQKN